jgi:hypothetical protein
LWGAGLCKKRDEIVKLFNDLLTRLVDEEESQEAVYTGLETAAADAKKEYLDADAAYELAKKTHKDAVEMKNLAISESDVAITAHKDAKDAYSKNKEPFETELESIKSDIGLIEELLRVLHQPATLNPAP